MTAVSTIDMKKIYNSVSTTLSILKVKKVDTTSPISAPDCVWHYTVETKLEGICQYQALLPVPDPLLQPGEVPVLWLSYHPVFEPSAKKGLQTRKGRILLDHVGLLERGIHAIRFQVKPGHPVYDLNGWKIVSNLAQVMIRLLISHGETMGSVPERDWFVTVDPIGMSSVLLVQHWCEGGWTDGLPTSAPYAFENGKLVARKVRGVSRKAV